MGFKAKLRPQKYKKARYTIENVSKKELSKIIREFDKLEKYLVRRRGPNMILMTATFI